MRTKSEITAEISAIRAELAARQEATPNARDFPNWAAYDEAIAAYKVVSRDMNARMQALGYERLNAPE